MNLSRSSGAFFWIFLTVACLATSTATLAANYSFTNIADDTDGTFSTFNPVGSVNASGTVAFSASGSAGTVGVYTGAGSSLRTVFEGPQSSYVLPFSPVINNSGALAYLRCGFGGGNHVVYDSGSGPAVIVTSSSASEPRLNNSGTVTFGASAGDSFNLYTWSNGVITERYHSSPTSTFIGLSTAASINDSGVLGFNGTLGPGGSQVNGLFYGTGGAYSTVALASGSTGFGLLSPFPTINNSGVVFFYGMTSGGTSGLYSSNGGGLTTYATTAGAYSNLHPSFGLSDSGVVAFKASTDDVLNYGPDGIFTGPNPIADHVVRIGDELFPGLYVTDLFYNGAINEHGQIAFNYTVQSLDHMTTRRGVCLATPDTSAPVLSNIHEVSVGGGASVIGGHATFGTVTQGGRFSADFFRPNNLHDLALRIGDEAAAGIDFGLASPSIQVWQLEFSGGFTGGAELVFHYDESSLLAEESVLRIRHFVNGGWEIPDQILDTVNDTITLSANSFSPFVLSVVPEPTSLSLLALAGLTLLRRRKQR